MISARFEPVYDIAWVFWLYLFTFLPFYFFTFLPLFNSQSYELFDDFPKK